MITRQLRPRSKMLIMNEIQKLALLSHLCKTWSTAANKVIFTLLTSFPNRPYFHGPIIYHHVGCYTPDGLKLSTHASCPMLHFYSAMTFSHSYSNCTPPFSVSWREGSAGNSSSSPSSEELGSKQRSSVCARRKQENVILRPGLRSQSCCALWSHILLFLLAGGL